MTGDLTAIIEKVNERLDALGFNAVDVVFDFDAVPDSIMDKAYRIETRLAGNEYMMGNRAKTVESVEIFIAYNLNQDPVSAWAKALDDRETIERGIVNDAAIAAIPSAPILTLNEEHATLKYLENYLVSKVVFRCDYIRDLTPTT